VTVALPLTPARRRALGVGLAVRFAVAAGLLFVLARLRRERVPRDRRLPVLVGLGAIGYAGMSLCYFSSFQRLSAGLGALLLYFYPALVVVLSAPAAHASGSAGLRRGRDRGDGAHDRARRRRPDARGRPGSGRGAALRDLHRRVEPGRGRRSVRDGRHGPRRRRGRALPARRAVVSTVEPVVSIALAAVVLGERLGPLQLVGGAVVLLAVGTLARLRPLEDETVVPA
jgi:hypothetical protein